VDEMEHERMEDEFPIVKNDKKEEISEEESLELSESPLTVLVRDIVENDNWNVHELVEEIGTQSWSDIKKAWDEVKHENKKNLFIFVSSIASCLCCERGSLWRPRSGRGRRARPLVEPEIWPQRLYFVMLSSAATSSDAF
jgi:hypothetical protein